MIKMISYFFILLAIVNLSGCQKKTVIAEINFEEKGNNSKYNDIKKISKRDLLNTEFIIQLKNNRNFPLEILLVNDQLLFYGIGCQIDFKKTQGSRIRCAKLKLYPFRFGNYCFDLRFLVYRDDITEDFLGDKITVMPKEKYKIKIILNKKELNEKVLARSIFWSSDENYMKQEREVTLTESKIPFDTLWEISVNAHILFAYRFTNEPNKVLLEHNTKTYSLEEGAPLKIIDEDIEELKIE